MRDMVEHYTRMVNEDVQLKAYRDWIEQNAFGFGERCFLWMWNQIVQGMPQNFTFLEVGVFRGQILGLIGLLAERHGKTCTRIGVTPLDSTDGHWESDYASDIKKLHEFFGISQDYKIIKGLSTDEGVKAEAMQYMCDIVYIDGGHTYDVVKSDLDFYPTKVKPRGLLVIDDCNNAVDMPDGYFRGIADVSRAVDETFPPFTQNRDWKLELNLVHNRVLRRI
jgi:hypothetical protein